MFMVMRVIETFDISVLGKVHKLKASEQEDNLFGYIPVASTYEKAVELSDNGKYQIIPIQAKL